MKKLIQEDHELLLSTEVKFYYIKEYKSSTRKVAIFKKVCCYPVLLDWQESANRSKMSKWGLRALGDHKGYKKEDIDEQLKEWIGAFRAFKDNIQRLYNKYEDIKIIEDLCVQRYLEPPLENFIPMELLRCKNEVDVENYVDKLNGMNEIIYRL